MSILRGVRRRFRPRFSFPRRRGAVSGVCEGEALNAWTEAVTGRDTPHRVRTAGGVNAACGAKDGRQRLIFSA